MGKVKEPAAERPRRDQQPATQQGHQQGFPPSSSLASQVERNQQGGFKIIMPTRGLEDADWCIVEQGVKRTFL
ncbi:hypothetical protein Y1Q_0022042 [Alligator mississippiensis]|uniref:Uncharacterized protein n=1 Tax=Alligator mississippiensis TaxID=8496 RepID=A0A151NLQ9_ALLMI|nr:hypothetical protein Y1Q_0022042 [Alligator mississippiensis]